VARYVVECQRGRPLVRCLVCTRKGSPNLSDVGVRGSRAVDCAVPAHAPESIIITVSADWRTRQGRTEWRVVLTDLYAGSHMVG